MQNYAVYQRVREQQPIANLSQAPRDRRPRVQ
jgi:hypothetical protein